jgi:hypothetical protein
VVRGTDHADLLRRRRVTGVDLRDDNRCPNDEKDDERSDPEDASADTFKDFASRDEAHAPEVGSDGKPTRGPRPLLGCAFVLRGLSDLLALSSPLPKEDA